ncbi:uncharacterized protein VTP21DRAFT_9110 [Calcarisporiella thermophila]|uniref:uncharacterized protein n=1 Tax=Calcarisporiella thermophila TaxID=911321 RepID=UPI003743BCEF
MQPKFLLRFLYASFLTLILLASPSTPATTPCLIFFNKSLHTLVGPSGTLNQFPLSNGGDFLSSVGPRTPISIANTACALLSTNVTIWLPSDLKGHIFSAEGISNPSAPTISNKPTVSTLVLPSSTLPTSLVPISSLLTVAQPSSLSTPISIANSNNNKDSQAPQPTKGVLVSGETGLPARVKRLVPEDTITLNTVDLNQPEPKLFPISVRLDNSAKGLLSEPHPLPVAAVDNTLFAVSSQHIYSLDAMRNPLIFNVMNITGEKAEVAAVTGTSNGLFILQKGSGNIGFQLRHLIPGQEPVLLNVNGGIANTSGNMQMTGDAQTLYIFSENDKRLTRIIADGNLAMASPLDLPNDLTAEQLNNLRLAMLGNRPLLIAGNQLRYYSPSGVWDASGSLVPASTQPNAAKTGSQLSLGAIIGITAGSVVILSMATAALILHLRRKRTRLHSHRLEEKASREAVNRDSRSLKASDAFGSQKIEMETLPIGDSLSKTNSTSNLVDPAIGIPYPLADQTVSSMQEMFTKHVRVGPVPEQVHPDARQNTVLLKRYRLVDDPAASANKVRQVEDTITSEEFTLEFFSCYNEFARHVAMLDYLRAPHIVSLQAAYDAVGTFIAVHERTGQALSELLYANEPMGLNPFLKGFVSRSLIQAMRWVCTKQVVYLTLTPSCLSSEPHDETVWKLCGFEQAMIANELIDASEHLLTPYSAPELLFASKGELIQASSTMDSWSLGCVLYEIWLNRPLFKNIEEARSALQQRDWFPPGLEYLREEGEEGASMMRNIQLLLKIDPRIRPNPQDL